MNGALYVILLVCAILSLIPAIVLSAAVVAAMLPQRRRTAIGSHRRPRITVIVPARDEASGIEHTLYSLLDQTQPGDRIVIVADNCSDETAAIARQHDVEVIERNDPLHVGKGYALAYAIKYLAADPPEIVVFVDADCVFEPGSLDILTHTANVSGRPTQGWYLPVDPGGANAAGSINYLAILVKNGVRPEGLRRMGLPCLLTGSGMAIPWKLFAKVPIDNTHIVEDMQLGIELTIAGAPPTFTSQARIAGGGTRSTSASMTQRRRWEYGHLHTIKNQGPRLLAAALKGGRLDCLALAGELCVPPLSLLVMIQGLLVSICITAMIAGVEWLPTGISSAGLILVGVSVVLAWLKFGRGQIPATSLLRIPLYALRKIPLYASFLTRPETQWVRTPR